MERVRCKEILLDTYSVGTTDIMEYADAHPNEYFDFTHVRSRKTDYGRLVVSEYEPDADMVEYLDNRGWHDCIDGWQRTTDGFSFVCRKNGRYIFITN